MARAEPLTPLPRYDAVNDPLPSALEFPGCRPVRLSRDEIMTYEGRLEFWDARTETAWVCEPISPCHEQPSHTLAALTHGIAGVRGSPIKCYGTMDLLVRDACGSQRLGAREGTGPEDDPLLRSQRRQGRAEGIRQGRAEGIRQVLSLERKLLRRHAAVRFGADTAERLSGLLDGITDPGRLAEAGEWIVRCDSGCEPLERVESGRTPDGSGGVRP